MLPNLRNPGLAGAPSSMPEVTGFRLGVFGFPDPCLLSAFLHKDFFGEISDSRLSQGDLIVGSTSRTATFQLIANTYRISKLNQLFK